ncbi:MAG: HAMP domain-containing histidine kinase [Tannerella sp.]|jgi:signal transduction histidine kinase|nr:HAMP domain-containing histidine kinase [Tannerella sp.]
MKLLHRINLNISIALLILFACWGTIFYYLIIDEINDETDDSLEHYSEYIITQALAGEKLPEKESGTNNSYYITEITAEYAKNNPSVRYLDDNIYIQSRMEKEPARIYKTIFRNSENRYFELTVMIPSIEKEDLKKTILFWIVILYVILLLVIILINSTVLRYSLRPLYTMVNWLDKLTLKKETPPLHINSGIFEFGKLSEALLRSAYRNAKMYEQQSRFIGHASHELQTPVAIALNRLEILADEPDLTESQLSQIIKTKDSLANIAKLNKTLLLLTKIENNRFPENKEIDLNRLLKSLTDDFNEAYAHLEINFIMEEHADLKMMMNEMLASVLFSNLIKNAYIHNYPKGRVTISVMPGSITFGNTSEHGALNPEYIYQHFYKKSKNEASSGLGLSLVKSICRLYKIKIVYTFENEMHHFSIQIPDVPVVRHDGFTS